MGNTNTDKSSINDIVLVGGSTRIPKDRLSNEKSDKMVITAEKLKAENMKQMKFLVEPKNPAGLSKLAESLAKSDPLMPMLIVLMKDTAARTIGRVCELISEAAINPAPLQPLLEALVSGLASEPRVAFNVCWAFISLADTAYEQAD